MIPENKLRQVMPERISQSTPAIVPGKRDLPIPAEKPEAGHKQDINKQNRGMIWGKS